ncbi:hypothetical protein SK128_001018 [Halocaridina rubra]|uniref:Fucosyltransferase n=1 Tax=Halocaridina rubra TaxID=373956 RepID=A0AAN8WGB1_HALRR
MSRNSSVAYITPGRYLVASVDDPNSSHVDSQREEDQPRSKSILIWTRFVHDDPSEWRQIFSRQIRGECPQKCDITENKEHWRSADAILFKQVSNVKYPPWHYTNQTWILFSIEAPTHKSWIIPNRRKDVFDWTMTYHSASDVVMPYGRVVPLSSYQLISSIEHSRDYWSEKTNTKFAIWMVSKCETPSRREKYVTYLQRYVKIDIYGDCGTLKCGSRVILPKLAKNHSHEDCYELVNQYKFYFAFENSICEYYITEKFFKALQMDVIPVVFGGGNYSLVAPHSSYINAMDFETPQDLAYYLQRVASNQTLYNSYFNWKRRYSVELGFPFSPIICDLCRKLHQQSDNASRNIKNAKSKNKSGHYYDVRKWFNTISKCRSWEA